MQPQVIQRILGLLLMIFSLSMIPPMVVSMLYQDGAFFPFLLALTITVVSGFMIWNPVRGIKKELRIRDGFLVVVLFWAVLGLSGALPFALGTTPHMSIMDALFESLSGLTTTGATVITNIDSLPPSILYYRQQLQWFGGMGIIVLAVAILPMLGIGGMQLYRAETPGPIKDNKLTPRITQTAKALWFIYLGLTIACGTAYWLAGMTPFDAIAHSFSTVAIGGFSTHDASIGWFDSRLIESIALLFMLLSGINFSLHFLALSRFTIKPYLQDSEFRTYITILASVAAITSLFLVSSGIFEDSGEAIWHGIFQAVSIGTTTGFTTTQFHVWPSFLPLLLIFASFIGGCAGSTGGGMKVIRFLMLFRQGIREIARLIHPNAQIPVKIGNKSIPESVITAVWGFFSLYVASFSIMLILLMATGLDQVTAFSALAACMNNLGPGLGDVGAHYGEISDSAKGILSFSMLIGRLEIFSILVLFSPAFWKK
ncbi:MAG: potassium transporter [Gammaproteobacteria bacterium]|uniref:Trk system potassium uptake protein n=1 Tax=Candidatus Thiopontia autotrophica TaxID=2841688 RepID=A0A8J6PDZ2_9GAMM|nr:potassium transporter [Candidatus Thiopontia autotrophica]MBL6968796.1 potassium transporter [Gammaproteobacteria bacterium]